MITVESLYKDYGNIRALDGVSFEVEKGEIVGFLGPNGAGKTTTMQIITGFMDPTEGRVLIDDLDVLHHPIEIKRRIGYLPETTPLYDDLTVYDFLDFVASVRRLSNRRTAIKEASERCGITDVLGRSIGTLSKGYRQRVGLAQAIIHDPDILILDEPTSGLDPIQIGEIRELIKDLGREKTVILSTHILTEVEQTCGRVIVINRGRIVADSPIRELKTGLSQGLRISYRGPLSPEGFERFGRVEPLGEEDGSIRIRIVPPAEEDIREEVYRFCKGEDIVLLEFYREERSLESIFRELTDETSGDRKERA